MKMNPKYDYLLHNPLPPKMVTTALSMYGLLEGKGTADNPVIIGWADEIAKLQPTPYAKWAADWYNADSIAWCGLFMALIAARCSDGRPERLPPVKYLSALAWVNYGQPVQFKGKEGLRLGEIWVGDITIFVRDGGGHVAQVVAVSANGKTIHVLGGNQSDAITITEIAIERLYAVRRPVYNVKPLGARHVTLSSSGTVSTNEG